MVFRHLRLEDVLHGALRLLARLYLVALVLMGGAFYACAQEKTGEKAGMADPIAAGLLEPGSLGDRILGSADAPVTIVEYASFTCSHCAHFHEVTMPLLQAKYIDTGKVRLIFREFPFDPLAMAASMLGRCAPEPRYFPIASMFFSRQKEWAMSPKPVDALLTLAREAGFTQESFEACLKDQKILDGINATKKRGMDVFKIDSTPTFFIGNVMKRGDMSIEELEKIVEPLLLKK